MTSPEIVVYVGNSPRATLFQARGILQLTQMRPTNDDFYDGACCVVEFRRAQFKKGPPWARDIPLLGARKRPVRPCSARVNEYSTSDYGFHGVWPVLSQGPCLQPSQLRFDVVLLLVLSIWL